MTKRQIAWASQHDWFRFDRDGSVFVRDYDENDQLIIVEFTDYQALRAWAGY